MFENREVRKDGRPDERSSDSQSLAGQSLFDKKHPAEAAGKSSPAPGSQAETGVSASRVPSEGSFMMRTLSGLIEKAKSSGFSLFLLNNALKFSIPFNRPHGIKILKITDEEIEVALPYKRANLNHIKGLHACAIATASEFASGVLLLSHLSPAKYRLIMESFDVKYHFQGREQAFAVSKISKDWIDEHVKKPLESSEKIIVPVKAEVFSPAGKLIATANINWQIKDWEKVKTNH